MPAGKPESVDAYIQAQPLEIQAPLESLRACIRKAAPEALETISYRIPTFVLKKNLVHFAAFKNHIGFYPTSSGIRAFGPELQKYKTSTGAVQFPLDQKLPLGLVAEIVRFRVRENLGQ
jgi:uncharacterized protein YdhG (YjbR/CyaY superfamily)